MVTFYSRGWKAPRIEMHVTEDGVRLRVDDHANPELWGEVLIDWEEVKQWERKHKAIDFAVALLESKLGMKAEGIVVVPDPPPMPEYIPEVPELPDIPPLPVWPSSEGK